MKEKEPPMIGINSYRWHESCLQLQYLLTSEETQWVDLQDAKIDHPRQMPNTLMSTTCCNQETRVEIRCVLGQRRCCRILRAIRCIECLYDFYLDEDENIRKVRRVIQTKKKKANRPRKTVIKYGIKVLWNAKHTIKLDAKNVNTMWQDAMALEVGALNELECF
eukprot:8938998-Ditylum_brightwellii.AAC.1